MCGSCAPSVGPGAQEEIPGLWHPGRGGGVSERPLCVQRTTGHCEPLCPVNGAVLRGAHLVSGVGGITSGLRIWDMPPNSKVSLTLGKLNPGTGFAPRSITFEAEQARDCSRGPGAARQVTGERRERGEAPKQTSASGHSRRHDPRGTALGLAADDQTPPPALAEAGRGQGWGWGSRSRDWLRWV